MTPRGTPRGEVIMAEAITPPQQQPDPQEYGEGYGESVGGLAPFTEDSWASKSSDDMVRGNDSILRKFTFTF